ncbi:MAG: hypothetical protein JST40_01895 [Armatimonadetes bacterium]|nr:hypothetical protein [Armatimonadota bacterium]
MDRPSKKEIKEAIEKLKAKPNAPHSGPPVGGNEAGSLSAKKSSKRIRKQGI